MIAEIIGKLHALGMHDISATITLERISQIKRILELREQSADRLAALEDIIFHRDNSGLDEQNNAIEEARAVVAKAKPPT